MGKTVISAEQVASHPIGQDLLVGPNALVTPLARDLARERGIALVTSATPTAVTKVNGADDSLESRVRHVLATMLNPVGGRTPPTGKHPVKLARKSDATLEPFGQPGPSPDQDVKVIDVIAAGDGSPMAAGYMSLTAGSFWWDFTYDEVQIVLEGELHLGGDGGDQIGYPGDIFYVPKGSRITFGTPTWTKFVYVTFPAEWGSQG